MKKSENSTHRSSTFAPLAVLATGLCVSAALYQLAVQSVQGRQQIYFDFRAREAVGLIERRMATYQQVLRGTASFFDVLEFVSREDFRKMRSARLWTSIFPAFRASALRRRSLLTF